MKRYGISLYALSLCFIAALVFSRCGGNSQPKKMAVDSMSPMGPAPDNNSANNPSLADTSYERDRTRPITDTMKKDTLKK